MRTNLNLTDEELIKRMREASAMSEYLIDPGDLAELLKRFEASLDSVYQAQQIIDAAT